MKSRELQMGFIYIGRIKSLINLYRIPRIGLRLLTVILGLNRICHVYDVAYCKHNPNKRVNKPRLVGNRASRPISEDPESIVPSSTDVNTVDTLLTIHLDHSSRLWVIRLCLVLICQ